jgi:hypothetical protein
MLLARHPSAASLNATGRGYDFCSALSLSWGSIHLR